MTWMSMIAHLSFSLLFWSAAFPCQAAQTSGASSISLPPQTNGTVACPLCPAQAELPSSPVTWPAEGVESNWGYPPSGPSVLPSCSADSICPVAWQASTKHGTAPKAYEVQVRLNGEDCRASENCCVSPKVTLVEGGRAGVWMNVPDDTGKPVCRLMQVKLGKAEGDCIDLRLTITPTTNSVSAYGRDQSLVNLHGEQTVHFDTVTGVVLSGSTPEPRCAQVVVTPVKRPVAPPAPNAHCPIQMVPPPTPCVPRPTAIHRDVMTEPAPIACTTQAQRLSTMTGPPAHNTFNSCPCFPHPVMTYLPAPVPEPAPMYRQPMPGVALTRFSPPPYPPVMGFIEPQRLDSHGHGSLIRVVHESGKAKLKMKTIDGMTNTAVRMKVETGEAGCLRFAAGKKHVHVSGKKWKAVADHVELCEDGAVILTGHVKVISGKLSACSSLKANHATLEVRNGKIENIDGETFSRR